jgi:hypothetical protein
MRKLPTLVSFLASVVLALWTPGCSKSQDQSPRVETSIRQQNSDPISEIIAIYDNAQIPGGTGISKGSYTKVDGYRYVNIAVEYQQESAAEAPLSLGVVFAYDPNGKLGSRRYFTFEQNFAAPADPQMITVSGKNCWHGSPHNKSSYIARFPIMGPYLQVFPSNGHGEPRKFSVVLYLTK